MDYQTDYSGDFRDIRLIKTATLIMNAIGMAYSASMVITAGFALKYLYEYSEVLPETLQNSQYSNLFAGYELISTLFSVVGSKVVMFVLAIALGMAITLMIDFLVPMISGIHFFQKINASSSERERFAAARKDSILKLIFSGVAIVIYLLVFFNINNMMNILSFVWIVTIFVLEIVVLKKVKNRDEENAIYQ